MQSGLSNFHNVQKKEIKIAWENRRAKRFFEFFDSPFDGRDEWIN